MAKVRGCYLETASSFRELIYIFLACLNLDRLLLPIDVSVVVWKRQKWLSAVFPEVSN